jgi:hypothetical protein
MGKYEDLAKKVGQLVDDKNKAYGNSFADVGDFLKILYPNGVTPENYTDMLCVVRVFDKLKRIATKKDAFGESPYRDIVGYALLGLQKDEELAANSSQPEEDKTSVPAPLGTEEGKSSILSKFRKSNETTCPTCGKNPRTMRCPTKCDENH